MSIGLPLWGYQVNQGSVLYLALEDDFSRIQKDYQECLAWKVQQIFILLQSQKH